MSFERRIVIVDATKRNAKLDALLDASGLKHLNLPVFSKSGCFCMVLPRDKKCSHGSHRDPFKTVKTQLTQITYGST